MAFDPKRDSSTCGGCGREPDECICGLRPDAKPDNYCTECGREAADCICEYPGFEEEDDILDTDYLDWGIYDDDSKRGEI